MESELLEREFNDAGFLPPATSWLESIGRAKFREFTVHWPFQHGLREAPSDAGLDPDAA